MREEIIVSGRMNHLIDPQLHIWHWQIPLYLFLGGLAAGILFFAALYTILGKEKEYPTAVKIAPFLTPVLLIIGLMALFIDLNHKLVFLAALYHHPASVTDVMGCLDTDGRYTAFNDLVCPEHKGVISCLGLEIQMDL